MNKEEYEQLEEVKTVVGNEIVTKYYNPVTHTMVSKTDIDCYKYYQALLDIKEYIEERHNIKGSMVYDSPIYHNDILDIINKALGSDKE